MALLVSTVRNKPDWPTFLALEASAFLARIQFLDLAVFDSSSLYNFSVLTFFYLDPPPGFPNHPALDFCLLGLLLRRFLAWRWVGCLAYWILRWIVNRSWQILKRPIYHVLTGVQANHVWLWFVLLPFGCLDGRQCSLGISPHSDEIGTFWG